jgi:hypothetical protein
MTNLLVPNAVRGLNPFLLVALYGAAGFYLGKAAGTGTKSKAEKRRLAQLGGAAGIMISMTYARKQIMCRLTEEPGGCP